MFTTRQNHAVSRHTTLLLVTALVLGLASSALFGATGNREKADPPGLLPPGADETAAPMNNARVETFAADVWQAIELQNAGNWQDAAAIWRQASASCESEVWRHLSIAVAQLYMGDFELADEQFAAAMELDRKNSAVHYFLGLLRMEQAILAHDHADAILLTGTRLVDYVPDHTPSSFDHGKAKSRLELEAINELETALTYISGLDLGAPLADVTWVIPVPYPVSQPLAPPTVGELLGSLGADNLAGKAHGLLANLYLDHNRPDQAEYHIDEAVSLGIAVPDAYRMAGELYEERGQSADAFRVFMKAMKQGDGIVTPGSKALRSLGNALEELF